MPRPRKSFGEAIDRRNGARLVVTGTARPVAEPPAPPKTLLAPTAKSWTAFWESEAAALVLPADLPALERLFELRDERARCMRVARSARLVPGSTGQAALNPLYKLIPTLDAEIRQLEDRYGLTPMSRLKLGITFGEATRSLSDLNADTDAAVAANGDDDPRGAPKTTDLTALLHAGLNEEGDN